MPLKAPPGGMTLRYVSGEMTLSPIQYHSFKVGSVTCEWKIAEGDDVRKSLDAVAWEMEKFISSQFETELKRFERRARQSAEHLRMSRNAEG